MSSWNLQTLSAALDCDVLQGKLNLHEPAQGIGQLTVAHNPVSAQAALGVHIASAAADGIEAYVRGDDLVATYGQTPQRPSRVQVYWRVNRELARENAALACIELQISVQTDKMDVATPIETISRVRADEAWRLLPEKAQLLPVRLAVGTHALTPDEGSSCLLFRLRESPWSYVEIVHPADFVHSELHVAQSDSGTTPNVTIKHHLFPETLEKGVIRRGQVIGAWLPRANDQAIAEQAVGALYQALLRMPPPLTT